METWYERFRLTFTTMQSLGGKIEAEVYSEMIFLCLRKIYGNQMLP